MKSPDFPNNTTWFNTDKPISFDDLKGHVVLLDFWTYCCINCIHALQDFKYLEEKYKDEPVVIIGVHTPKFNNEHIHENVGSAVRRYDIKHPVVVDNEYRMWRMLNIRAWPSYAVIGCNGEVVDIFSGEGERDLLDHAIEKEIRKGKHDKTIAAKKIEIKYTPLKDSFLKFPSKLSYDEVGKILFVSDSGHNRVLKIKLTGRDTGELEDIIGSGNQGYEDGSFSEACLNKPQGVFYKDNQLFICDTDNHSIRKADFSSKTLTTIAGNGKQGGHYTCRGKALEKSLNSPWDLVKVNGHIYIAMAGYHQIWKLDTEEGFIEAYAGNKNENIVDGPLSKASLAQPSGITFYENFLIFADSEVSAVRVCDTTNHVVFTLIGKGLFDFGYKDGSFSEAFLQHPLGVHYHNGAVFIADTYNNAVRIIELENKKISTLIYKAGDKQCNINGNKCDVLPLNEPNDVIVANDALYIADTNNHLIRIFKAEDDLLIDLKIEE
jgi:thiol-disulfide isomerase/thioredoxin